MYPTVATTPGIDQVATPAASITAPAFYPLYEWKLPAGFPSPAQDYLEQNALDLNTYLVHHKAATYFFNVKGDSMMNAGIHDGDKVLVDKAVNPQHKHIVVAIYNNEYTLKELFRKDGIIELRPANPAYQAIRLEEGDELIVWGVVTAVIRKLSY